MRPINLIPADDQAGRFQARTGSLSYIVLGALAAILVAVVVVVLTNNRISDGKAEVAALEQERDAAQARAESLSAFAEFSTIRQKRTATVASLAQSRFDWERVLREFALVLPDDVWLVSLTGTASPDVVVDDGAEVSLRDSVAGPALEIVGCGVSQDAVGSFVATLRDIDGVTRVTLAKSERPELSESTGDQNLAGGDDECRTRDFIARFEIVAAFDEVPVPAAAPEDGAPATPTTPGAPPASENAAGEPDQTGPAVQEGVAEGQQATELIPGS
jgi:Tfp pilus assembly protein PilN